MLKILRITPLVIVCTMLFTSTSFSQIDVDLKTNVFTLLKPNIGVEVGAGSLSLELSTRFYQFKTGTTGNYVTDIDGNLLSGSASAGKGNGMNINFMPAYYLSPKYSLDGWKIGPYVNYNLANQSETKTTRISAGAILGYKAFFGERIGLEFGFGYGKAFVNKTVNKKTQEKTDAKDLEDLGIIGKLFSNMVNTDLPINLKIMYRFGEGFQK